MITITMNNRGACLLLGIIDHSIATGEMRLSEEEWSDWMRRDTEVSLGWLRDMARQLRGSDPEGTGS